MCTETFIKHGGVVYLTRGPAGDEDGRLFVAAAAAAAATVLLDLEARLDGHLCDEFALNVWSNIADGNSEFPRLADINRMDRLIENLPAVWQFSQYDGIWKDNKEFQFSSKSHFAMSSGSKTPEFKMTKESCSYLRINLVLIISIFFSISGDRR